jgi:hypothetical protein
VSEGLSAPPTPLDLRVFMPRRNTPESAQAAVLLAVTLVQLFRSGAISSTTA